MEMRIKINVPNELFENWDRLRQPSDRKKIIEIRESLELLLEKEIEKWEEEKRHQPRN